MVSTSLEGPDDQTWEAPGPSTRTETPDRRHPGLGGPAPLAHGSLSAAHGTRLAAGEAPLQAATKPPTGRRAGSLPCALAGTGAALGVQRRDKNSSRHQAERLPALGAPPPGPRLLQPKATLRLQPSLAPLSEPPAAPSSGPAVARRRTLTASSFQQPILGVLWTACLCPSTFLMKP